MVNFGGFFFKEGALDDHWPLATGEYFATREVEGGVFLVAAGELEQTSFG
jgi:hypothetical protein